MLDSGEQKETLISGPLTGGETSRCEDRVSRLEVPDYSLDSVQTTSGISLPHDASEEKKTLRLTCHKLKVQ